LIWISRLGIRYHVRPPLIIQPLPDPIPREPTYRHHASRDADQDDPDCDDDAATWQEFSTPEVDESKPPPNPDPGDEIPPF
jgi:hypothetical protein